MNHFDLVARAQEVFGRHNPIVSQCTRREWLDNVVFPLSKETWGHLPIEERLQHLELAGIAGLKEPQPWGTWWLEFLKHDLPSLRQHFLSSKA